MILTDKITLKTFGNRKLSYYKDLGYDISGDTFVIKSEHLNSGSRLEVLVKCDFCENEVNISYKEYVRNISKGNKYACSTHCGSLKAKETCMEKYGVINAMCLDIVQYKTKKTNLEKYGTEYLMQSDIIKEKSKKSVIENWGVEHISQSDYFKTESIKTNMKKLGVAYPMQSDVVKEKSKKTLLKNYGVNNPSKSEEIQGIIKNNNLEKYGNEIYMKTNSFKEKSKITNLKKYGVDNPIKSILIQDKVKATNLKKYGNEIYIKTNSFKEKSKETLLEKYGIDNVADSIFIQNKVKATNLKKYGNEIYMRTNSFKEKSKETLLEKYGVDNINKNEEFRKNNFTIANNINYIRYLEDGKSEFKCDLNKDHTFEIHIDNYFHRSKDSLPLCTICYPISENSSIKEKELLQFIEENYKGEIISGYRDQLEIDIYLPELNLGFEFNGLYWHSDIFKENNYHLDKLNYFKNKGINIINIWEDDWNLRKDIIKSQIKNLLGLTENKIFARKCQVKEVTDSKIITNFLNNNHIQGQSHDNIKIGLFYNNELVSLMTFNKFEGRKKLKETEWNISRFCNKFNYNIIGGASKLLNYFIKVYNPSRLISYADRSWSEGNLYYKLGFILTSESKPDYKYIINGVRRHKSKFKKSNLVKEGYTGTENEITNQLGINKIYDCGKLKFELYI